MKKKLYCLLAFAWMCLIALHTFGQPIPVTKTNPMKVYVHYMPWFTAPENPGDSVTNFGNGNTGAFNKWGQHWSKVGANTKHPDNFITVVNHKGDSVRVR